MALRPEGRAALAELRKLRADPRSWLCPARPDERKAVPLPGRGTTSARAAAPRRRSKASKKDSK